MSTELTWLGILFCLTQSAMFSGLNLAVFSMPDFQLRVAASQGNRHAARVHEIRQDPNFLLTTILWGNVGINVLLTLLADSVLAGVAAFCFSTFAITIFGEITPQAFFLKHALPMASRLSPVLRLYQLILYPVAKPTALALDAMLGKAGAQAVRESDLRAAIDLLVQTESEIDALEGLGAINFLDLGDRKVGDEGASLHPGSVITLDFEGDAPVFPPLLDGDRASDPFLRQVEASGKEWVVIVDRGGRPRLVMNADAFLRAACMRHEVDPNDFCRTPAVITDPEETLDDAVEEGMLKPDPASDRKVDDTVILVWGPKRRIIVRRDVFRNLFHGIGD